MDPHKGANHCAHLQRYQMLVKIKLVSLLGGNCPQEAGGGQRSGFHVFLYQSSFSKTAVYPVFAVSASLHNCFMNFWKQLKCYSKLQKNA